MFTQLQLCNRCSEQNVLAALHAYTYDRRITGRPQNPSALKRPSANIKKRTILLSAPLSSKVHNVFATNSPSSGHHVCTAMQHQNRNDCTANAPPSSEVGRELTCGNFFCVACVLLHSFYVQIYKTNSPQVAQIENRGAEREQRRD